MENPGRLRDFFALLAIVDNEPVILDIYDSMDAAQRAKGMIVGLKTNIYSCVEKTKRSAAKRFSFDHKAIYSEALTYDLQRERRLKA